MAVRLELESKTERWLADVLAKQRRKHSEQMGWNEKRYKGKEWLYTPEAEYQRELDGFATEMIVARFLNLFFDPTLDRDGTLPDIGRNTQVKCRMSPKAGLKLRHGHRKDQIYVLCTRVYKNREQVQFVYDVHGWAWGYDVIQPEWRNEDEHGPYWELPQYKLHDFL